MPQTIGQKIGDSLLHLFLEFQYIHHNDTMQQRAKENSMHFQTSLFKHSILKVYLDDWHCENGLSKVNSHNIEIFESLYY